MKAFAFALLLPAAVASAATVRPDALLCESPEPFQVIASERWTSVGGAAQLQTAKASAEFSRLRGQAAGVHRQLSTREEAIRADAPRPLSSGSTASRTSSAIAEQDAAAQAGAVYERIANTCAASGSQPLAAEVVDRKPISGVARVRVQYQGSPAELWIRAADLTE